MFVSSSASHLFNLYVQSYESQNNSNLQQCLDFSFSHSWFYFLSACFQILRILKNCSVSWVCNVSCVSNTSAFTVFILDHCKQNYTNSDLLWPHRDSPLQPTLPPFTLGSGCFKETNTRNKMWWYLRQKYFELQTEWMMVDFIAFLV